LLQAYEVKYELPGEGLVRLNGEKVTLMFFIFLDEGYYCYFCAMKNGKLLGIFHKEGKPRQEILTKSFYIHFFYNFAA